MRFTDPGWRILVTLAALFSAGSAFALDHREANTSLALPAVPPVYGYQTINALGNLTFSSPVAVVSAPGDTNRVFVLEKAGVIQVITNLAAPTKTVFLDIHDHVNAGGEGGLLGLAFHPDWRNNRRFFVYYTCGTNVPNGYVFYDRVARFEIDPANPNSVASGSEVFLISQLDQANNHNAGCVQFGPDGYLYVSIGDEGSGGDAYNNSRFINKDFFSTILRLDVDKGPGSLNPNPHPSVHRDAGGNANYAVPNDNPFIGATSFNGQTIDPNTVRTEFWAAGLRNPWRFSFDPATGRLYCGDVGQDAYEEVDIITKGGDYGWHYREALHAYSGTVPPGVTLIDPIIEYPHSGGLSIPGGTAQGNCVIGGVVYQGNRLDAIKGDYVFGDYGFNRIFALRYDPDTGQAMNLRQLTTASQPVAFGTDPSNGDVLIVSISGTIQRLIYSDAPLQGQPLPATLSQTFAFSDLARLTPEPGIVPYDINVPFWSDYAIKSRWFSVPSLSDTLTFQPTVAWGLPSGTVWIKHFEMEMTNGVPASRRRLETRFLVRNNDGVHGFTYRWNLAQTDADLVQDGGQDETFDVHNPDGSVLRTQTWHYPARSECLSCHTQAGGFALGFNTVQMNRDRDDGQGPVNQIGNLSDVGYFSTPVQDVHALPALARPDDLTTSLERRVRSYLQANCVQCHQPAGTAQGMWDARITTLTDDAGLINGPLINDLGDAANRVLVPGDPAHSVLLQRMSTRGARQMPPLASNIADPSGAALLTEWITASLPGRQSFADWQAAEFGSSSNPDAAPNVDFDGDGVSNYLEWLTGTNPKDVNSLWKIGVTATAGSVEIRFEQAPDRGFQVEYIDALDYVEPWKLLNVPSNQPDFSSATRQAVVTDPLNGNPSRFYRVRVFSQ